MLGIYTRLSKEDDNSNSISNQIREAKEYISLNNIKEHKIYDEGEGFSGTLRVKDRPKLKEMMKDIESGIITSVWMRKQDRLARLGVTVLHFLDLIVTKDVYLFFGDKGHIDLSDPIQMFHLTIMAGVDALKPAQQSKATRKAIKDNFLEGKTHGILPYGYKKGNNRKMIVNEKEAKHVRLIYELSLSGIGTNKIAEKLNEFKIPTRYNQIGKGTLTTKDKYDKRLTTKNKSDIKWSGNTIRNIIINTTYKGIRRSKKNKTEYECPPIFEPAYWDKVNANLKNNTNYSGTPTKHNYLLKGIIRCGNCGRNYYGRTRVNKKDNYYMCSSKRYKDKNCGNRSINIDIIEDFIWQRFFVDKALKERIQSHVLNTDTEENIINVNEKIKSSESKLFGLSKEENTIDTYLAKGTFTEQKYLKQIKRINTEKSILDATITNLKEDLKALENIEGNASKIVKELDNLKDKISFNQRKELIKKYIDKIIINTHREDSQNGFFMLKIHYKEIIEDIEEYIIPFPKYQFALEICNEIIIPLNEKFKSLDKEELNEIVYKLYKALGKTYVEFMKKPNDFDNTYFIWLSSDNMENEFKNLCKIHNIPEGTILNYSID